MSLPHFTPHKSLRSNRSESGGDRSKIRTDLQAAVPALPIACLPAYLQSSLPIPEDCGYLLCTQLSLKYQDEARWRCRRRSHHLWLNSLVTYPPAPLPFLTSTLSAATWISYPRVPLPVHCSTPYTWTCMTVPTVITTCPHILASLGRVGLSGTSAMEIQPSHLLTGYKPVPASAPCQLGQCALAGRSP